MAAITRASIKDQIYDLIRHKILTQELIFGEKINIVSITREFNVSNTPVREALSMLEQDGLIESSTNYGYQIITMDDAKLNNISETVKVILLGAYVDIVSNKNEPELIQVMEQTLSIQKEKVEEASNEEFVRYAIDFDYSLVSVCHNKYLTDVFGNLIDLFTLVVLYEHETYGNDRYFHIKEHETILESIQSGDRDRTLHLILQHYNRQHL